MKRILWVAGLVAVVLLIGGYVYVSSSTREPGKVNAVRLVSAVEAYGQNLKAKGLPLPFEVPVQKLVEQKLLTTSDLGPFADLPANVRLVPASNPQDVLMSAQLPKGVQLMLLADGSVQQMRGSILNAATDTNLYTRIILVSNPESLRKVPGADPAKPTQELLTDYLKKNGVDLQPPASAVFDEKTKGLKVRANLVDLDRIEDLMHQLQPVR